MLPFAMVPVAAALAAADRATGWRGELAWAGAVALVGHVDPDLHAVGRAVPALAGDVQRTRCTS